MKTTAAKAYLADLLANAEQMGPAYVELARRIRAAHANGTGVTLADLRACYAAVQS